MITRVKLVNWKSHLESEFLFSRGVNALVGIMGSGKTSVMQAIAFALFGTLSSIRSKKMSVEDLIMNKPEKKSSATVELDFVVNGKTYTVKRTIERGKGSSAELFEDGKRIQTGSQAVTEEIERILGMDYELFSRAIYSEQNALEYFLQLKKEQRVKQIDNMLKLDLYEKVRGSSTNICNKLSTSIEEKTRLIKDIKEKNLDEKISYLEKDIEEKEKEKDVKLKELLASKEKEKELSEKVKEYEKYQEELNLILRKGDALESKLAEMKKQITSNKLKLKGIKIDKSILKKLDDEIEKLSIEKEEKSKEIQRLRDEVSEKNGMMCNLREQINEMKERIANFKKIEREMEKIEKELGEKPEKVIEEIEKNVNELERKVYTLEAEKKEMEKSLDELKGAKDKCPVCDAPLSYEKKNLLLEHRKTHIKELERKIRDGHENLEKGRERMNEVRRKVEQYKEMKKEAVEIEKLQKTLNDSERKVKEILESIEKISETIKKIEEEDEILNKKLEDKKKEQNKMEHLMEIKEEIERMEKGMKETNEVLNKNKKQRKLLESKLKGKDIHALREALREAVANIRSLETRIDSIEEQLKEKKSHLEELKKDKNMLIEYEKEVEVFEKAKKSMENFVEVLKNTQIQLRDEFLKTVNDSMNSVWAELYPYGDYKGIRMKIMEKEKDYILELQSTKGWVNVELVSGGERSLACLAMRIAFSLTFMPNLRWLILDEPTHNLDANAIEHFGCVLRDKMGNIIDQVFLITHEERLSDYITGSTYRLERDKESDGVTKVMEL